MGQKNKAWENLGILSRAHRYIMEVSLYLSFESHRTFYLPGIAVPAITSLLLVS